jgi:hypothetical protein
MPVILKDGVYAGDDAVNLRHVAKAFNREMEKHKNPFSVIKIEDGDADGGRYQIERTVDYVWIYRVLPAGMLYIAKAYTNGTEQIYGDSEALGEELAVSILMDLIKNMNQIVSQG